MFSPAPSAKELAQFLIHAFRLFFLWEMPALGDGDAAHVARQPLPDLQYIKGFADEFEIRAPDCHHRTVDQIVLILHVLLHIYPPSPTLLACPPSAPSLA